MKSSTGPYNPDSGKFSKVREISRAPQALHVFLKGFPGNSLLFWNHSLSTRMSQTILDKLVDGLIEDSRIELCCFDLFAKKQQASCVIRFPSGKKVKCPALRIVIFVPGCIIKKKGKPKIIRNKQLIKTACRNVRAGRKISRDYY